jgi:hypothetical protein
MWGIEKVEEADSTHAKINRLRSTCILADEEEEMQRNRKSFRLP